MNNFSLCQTVSTQRPIKFFLVLLSTLFISLQATPGFSQTGYSKMQSGTEMLAAWNNHAIEWVRQSERGPTISGRFTAYVNIAMFDTWAAFRRNTKGVITNLDDIRPLARQASSRATRDLAISLAAHRVTNTIGKSILKQEYLELGVGEDAELRLAALQSQSNELLSLATAKATQSFSRTDALRCKGRMNHCLNRGKTRRIEHSRALAENIADMVAQSIYTYALTDGSNQQNDYADTSGYSVTPWAYPVPDVTDGIKDYNFLEGYTFTAFDPVEAEKATNNGQAQVHPGVMDGSLRLTETWQSLTQLGVFPPDDDGGPQVPLTPHWGDVATLVLTDGSQLRPTSLAGPYLDSGELNPDWVAEARQLVEFARTMQDGNAGSALQRARSEYWELGDATEYPPGWWLQRASDLVVSRGIGQRQALKVLLGVSIATFEAGIAAWDTKYAFDTVRPISAVNELFYGSTVSDWRGEQMARTDDRDHWRPYQLRRNLTPPFPDIVSGHSTFSNAASTVLIQILGSNYFDYTTGSFSSRFDLTDGFDGFTENGNEPTTLNWRLLSAAAEEAGLSRLYGGIHMMEGNLKGQLMGTEIGHLTIDYLHTIFGERPRQPPKLVFGTGGADDLGPQTHDCGAIEIYGFHDNDHLSSSLNCRGVVSLFGGAGVDKFTIAGNGKVWIRDFEPGETLQIASSRLNTSRHQDRDYNTHAKHHHETALLDGHTIELKLYSKRRRPYLSALIVDGMHVAFLEDHWTLQDIEIEFVR